MTFTREDILKIQNALLQLGRKDSEFKDANTPLNSNDEIAILQDGINKKVSINNLLSTLGLLKKDDFINVSDRYDEYYIQLSEAITIIANNKRKKGLVITFLNLQGDWKIFQFDGELNNFSNTDYWKDLFDFKYPIVNSVLPDEEDLTLTLPNEDNNSFIKLKDKEYDATNFSGMGTKIIRKNIIKITLKDGTIKRINYLSPDVFNSENTIYVIKYDFTLNEDITIPKNCILEFDGGSISDGFLVLSENNSIFGGILNNVCITGNNKNVFKDCTFNPGILNTEESDYNNPVVGIESKTDILIENCVFNDGRFGLFIINCTNVTVNKCKFKNYTLWGNYFRTLYKSKIINNICENVNDGFKLNGKLQDVIISNNISFGNVRDGLDFAGLAADGVIISNNIFCNNSGNESNGIEFKCIEPSESWLNRCHVTLQDLIWRNISFTNNVIYGNFIGLYLGHIYSDFPNSEYYPTDFSYTICNIKISGNLIHQDRGSCAIKTQIQMNIPNSLHVSNNTILDTANSDAIILSNTKHGIIENNNIYCYGNGIRVDTQGEMAAKSNENLICNNKISSYKANYACINLYANTQNNFVRNNDLRSFKGSAIIDLGTNNKINNDNYNPLNLNHGTNRPYLSDFEIGYEFLDESLNPKRPIWYSGGGAWIDATGATV